MHSQQSRKSSIWGIFFPAVQICIVQNGIFQNEIFHIVLWKKVFYDVFLGLRGAPLQCVEIEMCKMHLLHLLFVLMWSIQKPEQQQQQLRLHQTLPIISRKFERFCCFNIYNII